MIPENPYDPVLEDNVTAYGKDAATDLVTAAADQATQDNASDYGIMVAQAKPAAPGGVPAPAREFKKQTCDKKALGVCLREYQEGDNKYRIFVANSSFDDIDLTVRLSAIENLEVSRKADKIDVDDSEIHKFVIKPRQTGTDEQHLFDLTKRDKSAKVVGYDAIPQEVHRGNPNATPDGTLYSLPYPKGANDNKGYKITQGFGGQGTHQSKSAVDFDMPADRDVAAARAGVVADLKGDSAVEGSGNESDKDKWNFIRIRHKEDGTVAIYGHLKKGGVKVKIGDQVKLAQVIGVSGNSGYSTGAHLHFEVAVADGQGRWKATNPNWKFRDKDGKPLEPKERPEPYKNE